MVKTNAVRVLDGLGIRYELREYNVEADDLSAEMVAAKIGLPPEQLFKALAERGDRNGIFLAVIFANQELDFKALAHQTGDRKVEMLPLKEVQSATGYIRGGVTALACKRDLASLPKGIGDWGSVPIRILILQPENKTPQPIEEESQRLQSLRTAGEKESNTKPQHNSEGNNRRYPSFVTINPASSEKRSINDNYEIYEFDQRHELFLYR